MIAALGRTSITFLTELGNAFLLFRDAILVYVRELTGRLRRSRTGQANAWKLLMDQMLAIGVGSLPIVLITSASTGMVFALEIGEVLIQKLGSPLNLGRIVSTGVVRELGPALTGLMVAARNGSAIAAEIGSMTVTEQVDALSSLGTSPASQLVAPRLLGAILVLPLLAFFADVVGVLGGYIVAVTQLGVGPETYLTDVLTLKPSDVLYGLFKTFFYGTIIAVVACYRGLTTTGGAEGVGKSCISAVVWSCMAILIADYVLTAALF